MSESKNDAELFKVYLEDEKATQEVPCMFAYLFSTAYMLQAWEYEGGKIKVEMFFRPGVDPNDDGEPLEYQPGITTRAEALEVLQGWGEQIQALEKEEKDGRWSQNL